MLHLSLRGAKRRSNLNDRCATGSAISHARIKIASLTAFARNDVSRLIQVFKSRSSAKPDLDGVPRACSGVNGVILSEAKNLK